MELIRLTIPRRVYTQAHMDVTAESVAEVHDRRQQARGLKMIYEPKYLRNPINVWSDIRWPLG